MSKKILVLSTLDERGNGHAWSAYKFFKDELELDSDFICLLRTYPETEKYFIDAVHNCNIKNIWYKIVIFLSKMLFFHKPDMRYFYKGYDFVSYKDILKKIDYKPDYIFIGTYHFFLSPKSIYKLWKNTGATMIISMVDEKILSGGCPYPIECYGYEEGCKECKIYPYLKCIPRNIVNQKEKYFSRIPLHLVGTSYDLNKAQKVSFLKNKKMHSIVGVPNIPFTYSKFEARTYFDIPKDRFVIMAGAVNPNSKVKGFSMLVESLNRFSKCIKNKKVTFMLLGKEQYKLELSDNIDVAFLGFQDLRGLFTAYYACDVFVSPSLLDSGPFMVNYAIACGRPVVAFPVGIALDLILHRETGWIASFKDVNDFASGIEFFYSKTEDELQEIGDKCISHIKSYNENKWYDFMQLG